MMPVRTAQATQPDLILELREQCLGLLSFAVGHGWRVGFGRHKSGTRGGSNLYSFAPSEAAGLEHENPRNWFFVLQLKHLIDDQRDQKIRRKRLILRQLQWEITPI